MGDEGDFSAGAAGTEATGNDTTVTPPGPDVSPVAAETANAADQAAPAAEAGAPPAPAGFEAVPPGSPVPAFVPNSPVWGAPLPGPHLSSTSRLAIAAQSLLAMAAVLALLTAIVQILGIDLQGRVNTGRALFPDVNAFNKNVQSLTLLALVLQVATALTFLRWQWQSEVNATAVGAGTSAHGSTRSAMVVWFVPIANLFMPFGFIRNLYDRLLAPLPSGSARWLVRAWWTLWIVGDIAGWFVMLLTTGIKADSTAGRIPVIAGQAFIQGLLFADAILAIGVIRAIQRLSDARIAAWQGNDAVASELLGKAQQPRVSRLPMALAALAIVAVTLPMGVVYAGSSAAPSWAVFEPADKAFTVEMPAQPLETKIPAQTTNGVTISGDMFRSGEGGDIVFIVTWYDYPTGTLEALGPSTVYANMDRSLGVLATISSTSDITISGLPAHEIHATQAGLGVIARYLVDGNRVYVIEADYRPALSGSADIARFLDSFALK
jgi:hypothetical protein